MKLHAGMLGNTSKSGSEDMGDSVDQQLYQEVIGSILYVAISTGPDISYASSLWSLSRKALYYVLASCEEDFALPEAGKRFQSLLWLRSGVKRYRSLGI